MVVALLWNNSFAAYLVIPNISACNIKIRLTMQHHYWHTNNYSLPLPIELPLRAPTTRPPPPPTQTPKWTDRCYQMHYLAASQSINTWHSYTVNALLVLQFIESTSLTPRTTQRGHLQYRSTLQFHLGADMDLEVPDPMPTIKTDLMV